MTYQWTLKDSEKHTYYADAPNASYYSPHLIFYIKSYKNTEGVKEVLDSVDNLYKFYYETIKNINQEDQSVLKIQTDEIIKGLTTDFEVHRYLLL